MKVLVIGGYGAFGARIVRRLKRIQALEVLTGGRNPVKADVVLDVKHGEILTEQLAELKPHLVIHTAGKYN
jgi:dTDP-4-dehydrorhamnose reductase